MAKKNSGLGRGLDAIFLDNAINEEVDHNTDSHINQIQNIIDTLRTNPTDRRLVASMWNPAEIGKMALPPCHHSLWFYSRQREDGKRVLDTTWH